MWWCCNCVATCPPTHLQHLERVVERPRVDPQPHPMRPRCGGRGGNCPGLFEDQRDRAQEARNRGPSPEAGKRATDWITSAPISARHAWSLGSTAPRVGGWYKAGSTETQKNMKRSQYPPSASASALPSRRSPGRSTTLPQISTAPAVLSRSSFG